MRFSALKTESRPLSTNLVKTANTMDFTNSPHELSMNTFSDNVGLLETEAYSSTAITITDDNKGKIRITQKNGVTTYL